MRGFLKGNFLRRDSYQQWNYLLRSYRMLIATLTYYRTYAFMYAKLQAKSGKGGNFEMLVGHNKFKNSATDKDQRRTHTQR